MKKSIVTTDLKNGEGYFASKWIRFYELANCYKHAADLLIEKSRSDNAEHLTTIPIIYLYRHAVELYLKDMIGIMGEEKFGHSLGKLEAQLTQLVKQNGYTPVPETVSDAVIAFEEIAPRSTELRYEDSSNSLLSSMNTLFCNFLNAKTHVEEIENYFEVLKKDRERDLGLTE